MLPKNISYSSLQDFQFCPYYYYLAYIKRVKRYEDNAHTYHGKIVHDLVQKILLKKIEKDFAIKHFTRLWTKFCSLHSQPFTDWIEPTNIVLGQIEQQFISKFQDYEVLKVEERLEENCDNSFSQMFKGFIDIVLFVKQSKKVIIADFKNTSSSYMFCKFKDKFKDYQLTLYKNFFCQKYKLDFDEVETYFILLEKDKGSKEPIKFIRVTSGNKKIENALNWLNETLAYINSNNDFIKNRTACHKYGIDSCAFCNTIYCVK